MKYWRKLVYEDNINKTKIDSSKKLMGESLY